MFLNFTHTQHHRVFLLNCIQCPLQLGYIYCHFLSLLPVVIYKNFVLKYWKMPWYHIPILIYLLSLTLGHVDLDITPGQPWLCIRTILFPPQCHCCVTLHHTLHFNAHCSNETFPFWMQSLLNMLNFGILPTTWEATLGQEISHCGSGIFLCNCMFTPSTDIMSSLPT